VVPVIVVLAPEARSNPSSLGALLIANGTGRSLPLRELADVFTAPGRFSLFHDGSRRLPTVTCTVKGGGDIAAFVSAAKEAVSRKVKLPSGVYTEWSGEAEQQSAAQYELLIQGGIALAVIVMLLSLVFRHPGQVALVLANVPFAIVGGLLAALASGGLLSIGSLVGFVTLFGISMRNSIMMVSHYEHLVEKEGCAWTLGTVKRGAEERFLPVVMTALVTALGLLPLAMGKGEAGSEIEGPMATVIVGGLVSSTLLNLILLPAIAWRWSGIGKQPAA
jgi:Cu/Ag efflux pump CusA